MWGSAYAAFKDEDDRVPLTREWSDNAHVPDQFVHGPGKYALAGHPNVFAGRKTTRVRGADACKDLDRLRGLSPNIRAGAGGRQGQGGPRGTPQESKNNVQRTQETRTTPLPPAQSLNQPVYLF